MVEMNWSRDKGLSLAGDAKIAALEAEITRLRIKADLYDVHCHHRLVLTERLETAEAVIEDLRRDLADAKGNHPQPQSDSGIQAEIGSDGNHLKDQPSD